MRLIVASYYDETFVPVVRELCKRAGWQVCDWLSAYPSQDPAISPQRAFPGAMVHVPQDAARGLLPPTARSIALPEPDADVLRRMAPYETMFLRMLDIYDPDGRSFTARERREAYYALLRYGLYILREHRPTLFLAGTIPHSLHDYMLYAVCKAHGIDTLIYLAFTIPGYLLLMPDVDDGTRRLRAVYRRMLADEERASPPLPAHLEAYLAKVQANYAVGEPWYSRLRDHSLLGQTAPGPLREALHSMLAWVARARWIMQAPGTRLRQYFSQPLTDFFKMPGRSLKDSRTTLYELDRIRRRGLRTKRRLLELYRQLQRKPDLTLPYLFVPLQYQPEATTSPLGGSYIDQILMIRMLSRYLPQEWKICVKEHRTTFDPELRGEFARDEAYYREIASLPNVMLVPMEHDSFELIDSCRAVATVTGTAAWEALARGKPAIAFGNAWYRDCDGAFDGSTEAGCRQALAAIAGGVRPDPARVRLFLHALAEVCVRADRDTSYVLTDLSPEQSRRALIDHILREHALLAPKAAA